MSTTWQIFVEFLKLKVEEIGDGIRSSWPFILLCVAWIAFLWMLSVSQKSSSFILHFILYYVTFLALAITAIFFAGLVVLMIINFCSWIKNNWQQARSNVEGRKEK